MAFAETSVALADTRRPFFADVDTIRELLGVPEGTLRKLACDRVVAAHKLGEGPQSKCVYLFSDVEAWVSSRPAPEWVERYQNNLKRSVA